jgi:flavin-dependent dehydrogenase
MKPVVVIGGGPGGSVCAARLAQRGRRVILLEKGIHPRFHLGESLLPQSLPVFEALGLLEEIRARFIEKRGARFHEHGTDRTARYAFAEAFRPTYDHAFQVPRDEFDELLFRHARKLGADVRERWEVVRVLFDGDRATGVEAKAPDGALHTIDASFVVDASGRSALFAHASRTITRIEGLDKTALFTQYRGAWRDGGDRAGDIQIVLYPGGWFWVIPFKDGRTSVGAIASSAWIRAQKSAGATDPDALFGRAVAETPAMQRMLEGAHQVFPAEATADFSFRVRDLVGHGWLAVGDAGGFIDPLFSTGAHLAMHGGLLAGDAIDAAMTAGDVASRGRYEAWEREMRRGADLFVGAVQAFYGGALIPYLFVDKPHPFLKGAITSLLAGDVFDEDARWAAEMRARFPARA